MVAPWIPSRHTTSSNDRSCSKKDSVSHRGKEENGEEETFDTVSAKSFRSLLVVVVLAGCEGLVGSVAEPVEGGHGGLGVSPTGADKERIYIRTRAGTPYITHPRAHVYLAMIWDHNSTFILTIG